VIPPRPAPPRPAPARDGEATATLVAISGSWRPGSFTEAALSRVLQLASDYESIRVERLYPQRFPFYERSLEMHMPPVIARARRLVSGCAGLIIASPEYNGAPPGALQNLLEWLSRPWGDCPLTDKPVATVTTSEGARGGARAHDKLREMLTIIGCQPVGPDLCLPHAQDFWAADGAGTAGSCDGDLRLLLDAVVPQGALVG
jgi:chromate reductase, NAD(P)H dehydrogenase (quinone)